MRHTPLTRRLRHYHLPLRFEQLEDRSLLAPVNDAFASATVLFDGTPQAGTTIDATAESGELGHAGDAAQKSVWYEILVPTGTSATVSVTPTLAGYDTQLAAYSVISINNLAVVASADAVGAGGAEQILINNSSQKPARYWIAVDGLAGSSGTFIVVGLIGSVPPPVNDSYVNRTGLTIGTAVAGTTVTATAENAEPEHAGDAAQKSVWYEVTLPAFTSMSVVVTPTTPAFDPQLAAYTGSAVNSLTPVTAANGFGANQSEQIELLNLTDSFVGYQIAVDGFNGSFGTFNIVASFGGPANDKFANAMTLASGASVAGTTVNATAQSGEPYPAEKSVWYEFTVPAGNSAIVTVTPTDENYDPQLAVYTGTEVNSLTLVASADENDEGNSERVEFINSGVSAVTYAIAVDGYGGNSGPFNIVATFAALPPNDDFANAATLVAGDSVAGTTVRAFPQSGEPEHHYSPAVKSVWYVFTVPAGNSAIVTVTPTDANYDAVLTVYKGATINSLTEVAFADIGYNGDEEQVEFSNAGLSAATYAIAVDAFDGESGPFSIIGTIAALPPGFNHEPTCTIGPSQNSTDENGLQTVPNWITNCSANDPGQSIVTISVEADLPELFTAPPAVDASGKLSYDPAPNVRGTAIVTITIIDDGGIAVGGADETTVKLSFEVAKPHPWRNTNKRLDVNDDTHVVADDVLDIINRINAFGSGELPPRATISKPYYDTDGDDQVTAGDVIAVINAINAGLGGEAEGGTSDVPTAQTAGSSTDEMLMLLALDTAGQGRRARR